MTSRGLHPPQAAAAPLSAASLASQFLLSQLHQAYALSAKAYEANSKQLNGGIALLEAEVGDAMRRRFIEKEIDWLEEFEVVGESAQNILVEVEKLLIQSQVMIKGDTVVGEVLVDLGQRLCTS